MPSAPTQLFERFLGQTPTFVSQHILLVNAPEAPEFSQFTPQVSSWSVHFGFHQQLAHRAGDHQFSAEWQLVSGIDLVLFYWPKEKRLARYQLAHLAAHLPPTTEIWLVGEKKSGIKSCAKQLPTSYEVPHKLTDGHHCSIFASRTGSSKAPTILADTASWVDYLNPLTQQTLPICTYPGVFADQSIDEGSDYLLQHLKLNNKAKTVLDYACGAGVLGAAVAQGNSDLKITYADVSAIALAATQATLERNGLNYKALQPTAMLDNAFGQFDAVISHPPFHTGIHTDYEIGRQFLRAVQQHLTPNGELWLVANKFLPWPELLEAQLGNCDVVVSNNKYAVYRSCKSRR